MRVLVTTLALLTLTASCRRSPVHEVVPHATDDAALRAGDAAADVAESAPVIDGAERSGTLTAATFALDTRSRVLVVHGTYMSVNSWFSGDKTTSVFVF